VTTVELIEDRVYATATNGVHWGTQSTLAATVSHFPELEAKLELLRSRCNADLTEDQVVPSGPGRARPQSH
jgi:hypothetical protein